VEDDVDVWRYAILQLHARNNDDGDCLSYCWLVVKSNHSVLQMTKSVAAGFSPYGMPPSACNDTGTALDQDSLDWSRDLVTLTFDLGGHGSCGWHGSSSSIRIPSLKFVGLAIQKTWRTMRGSGDLDLWTLKLVRKSHLRWGTFLPNLGMQGLRVLELFAMYATDGLTDRSNA